MNHFTDHFGTLDCRCTYLNRTLIVDEEYLVELNRLAFFCIADMMHEQFLSLFRLELLTVNLYNCVHVYL